MILKNCAPLTECISKISKIQIVNAKDIHVVTSMYNLIEYSDNYLKTSGRVWKYDRDERGINDGNCVIDFPAANNNSANNNMSNRK